MLIWQADLHRPPLTSAAGEPLWELLICDQEFTFSYGATCPQAGVNGAWVTEQVKRAMARAGPPPDQILVFRPQALSLLQLGCEPLGLEVRPTRHVNTLYQWLQQRGRWYPTLEHYTGVPYNPLQLDQPPPLPLPEALWGNEWRFAALNAGEFEQTLPYEPIPIRHLPPHWMPLQLGLASNTPLPGVVIDAGRQAMPLCQWLQANQPAWLTYMPGDPDGLILDAGLVDRWVMTTFSDPAVASAGKLFQQRQQASQGLHFLLIRPDDSGLTYTGLWLLRRA
ncbi:MAG: DUF1092 family protein [Leptolyngbyaceae cyanobacterium SM2_3_12]|nr:DUF1092 family protein [Leptolyngbyaceae cyanobacterium SM2_3_12]